MSTFLSKTRQKRDRAFVSCLLCFQFKQESTGEAARICVSPEQRVYVGTFLLLFMSLNIGYLSFWTVSVWKQDMTLHLMVSDENNPLDFLHFNGFWNNHWKVDHSCKCQDVIWSKKLFSSHPVIRADSLRNRKISCLLMSANRRYQQSSNSHSAHEAIWRTT